MLPANPRLCTPGFFFFAVLFLDFFGLTLLDFFGAALLAFFFPAFLDFFLFTAIGDPSYAE